MSDKIQRHIHIEQLSHEGRGIARINGKTTFIDGALHHETVSFELTRKKKDYDEGRVTEVEMASKHRVQPKCEHHHVCGGCKLQHLEAEQQIHQKQQLMLDTLSRIGHLQVDASCVAEPLSASSWGYRSRARLSVHYVAKKNRVLVGFREQYQPRFVADIQSCHILPAQVGMKITEIADCIEQLSCKTAIPQIEVAVAENATALIIRHLEPLTKEDQILLADFGRQQQFRMYLQPKGLDSIHLLNSTDSFMLQYALPNLGLTFHYHPADFTQVNVDLNQQMIHQALDWMQLEEHDQVFDLFCGLGNFSLPMAKHCQSVIGVEFSKDMVSRATQNAALNHIQNTQFYAEDLTIEGALKPFSAQTCHKLLIDPPRTGALCVVQSIEHLNPDMILYVSCNPATFARDADVLVHQKGYTLSRVGVMDMFPHTTHVEVMGLFLK